MSTQSNFDSQNRAVWEARWNALAELFYTLQKRLRHHEVDRADTIQPALERLQLFGEQQFKFFYTNFGAGKLQPVSKLLSGSEFEAYRVSYSIEEHILSRTLGQIANDVDVLRRALEQRIVAESNQRANVQTALQDADTLAFHSLKQMKQASGHEPHFTVLTYFRRNTNVRVVPYAPVPLIGLPVTAGSVKRDYLAIPHEIGHHLYWDNWNDAKPSFAVLLQGALDLGDSVVDGWIEEIFADVVGCYIDGPVMGLSIQEMMRQHIGTEFEKADGRHPTPALRPYLHVHVLRCMGAEENAEKLTEAADALERQWDAELYTRLGVQETEKQKTCAALDVAKRVANKVLHCIQEQVGHVDRWSHSLELTAGDPYQTFRLNHLLTAQSVPPLTTEDPWPKRVRRRLGDQELAAKVLESVKLSSPMPPDEWLRLFELKGWTTSGPGGLHTHP